MMPVRRSMQHLTLSWRCTRAGRGLLLHAPRGELLHRPGLWRPLQGNPSPQGTGLRPFNITTTTTMPPWSALAQDMQKMCPLWLQITEDVREDPEVIGGA